MNDTTHLILRIFGALTATVLILFGVAAVAAGVAKAIAEIAG